MNNYRHIVQNKYVAIIGTTLATIAVSVFHYQIDDLSWEIKRFAKLSKASTMQCEGVTTKAKVMRPFNIERAYPKIAESKEIEGKVVLSLSINEKGYVTSADVIEAYPSGIFENAAITVAKKMLYYPATDNCTPMPSTAKLTVMYKMDD